MCVAVPGRVVSIDQGQTPSRPAQVVFGGGQPREVDLAMLPEVGVGDYVIVHSGFAIKTVSQESAMESYGLFAQHDPD